MRKVRVLHVCHLLRYGGGIEVWVIDLFRNYNKERLQMDYCFADAKPGYFADELEETGTKIISYRR